MGESGESIWMLGSIPTRHPLPVSQPLTPIVRNSGSFERRLHDAWEMTVIADPQSASHQTLEIYWPLQTSKHHWPDGVAKPQRRFLLGGWKDALGRYKKTASNSYSIMTFRSFSIQHSFDVNGFFKIFSSFSALRMVPTCLRKFHSSPGLKDIPEGKESDGVRHKWAQKSLVSLG